MSTNMSMNKDLERVRAAAQALHGAISDAAAKRGSAIKADLAAVGQKAKSVTESVKASIGVQTQPAAQKRLKEAVADLEAVQKHAADALKNSGQAFQTSIRQTLADARASAQKLSEAVAAVRSAAFSKNGK
jgi:hypothetical protein